MATKRKRKKKSKGKAKGDRYEYVVCNDCTELLGERCIRNMGAEHHGDVRTPSWFPFIVEAKHYQDLRLDFLLTGHSKCDIAGWWKQTVKHCEEQGQGRWPLLVMHRTYAGTFCMMEERRFDALCRLFPQFKIIEAIYWRDMAVINWKDFLCLPRPVIRSLNLRRLKRTNAL